MIRVALIDDDNSGIEQLEEALRCYGKENGEEFRISKFINGLDFISEYTSEYDLVFMDIDMPHLNGMETAKLLRVVDSRVSLIFVTNLANYAIKGYEVDAADFIVKPIKVKAFCCKLKRIISRLERSGANPYVSVNTRLGTAKVFLSDIFYITTKGRYVLLHTKNGEYDMRMSMKETEKKLAGHNFVRGDNSSMVNLMHVSEVTNEGAMVNGKLIPASRNRKKALLDAFTLYLR